MPSIAGQSILIIGGSSGIGFAAASAALDSNVGSVAIASSSRTRVDDAVLRLKTAHPSDKQTITGHTVDLEDEDDVEGQIAALLDSVTLKNTSKLDHIIVTAGRATDMKPLAETTASLVKRVAHSRLAPMLLLGKLAPAYLNPGPQSSLIFTSGVLGERPRKGNPTMAAFAGAGYIATQALALDLAPSVRVNMVSPGATETEMWGEHKDMLKEMTRQKSLLGKAGAPEEVAEAYVYLMRNTDATGSVVGSNGGGHIHG